MRLSLTVLIFLYAAFARDAHAFPEMVRHGYSSCITCHYSPSGGGVLTGYGRELSRELLSWEGAGAFKVMESESNVAHGLVRELPEWLGVGGDFRIVRVTRDTTAFSDARWIPMQADIETAFSWKTLTLVGTLGPEFLMKTSAPGEFEAGSIVSRRHYLLWRPLEPVSIRFGLFLPMYGLGTAEHALFIRRSLQLLDQGNEAHAFEIVYTHDPWEIHATAMLGRLEKIDLGTTLSRELERGETLTVSYFLAPRSKIGLSIYSGRQSTGATRSVFGPFGILGISERAFLMGELDFQSRDVVTGGVVTGERSSIAQYFRANYEFIRGMHIYLAQQYLKANSEDPKTAEMGYGPGLQIFPRPHFEIQFELQLREYPNDLTKGSSTYTSLLLHYYL